MNYIDISWPITDRMTTYKNRDKVILKEVFNFDEHAMRQSHYSFGSHIGTHIDAPSHFLKEGKSLETIPLDVFIGSCQIIDLTHVNEVIRREDLEAVSINDGTRLLIKTKNSFFDSTALFNTNFVYIDSSAAEYLVSKNIKLLGFDYLGIERGDADHKTHKAFMAADIPILEGIRLAIVAAGEYQLYCLPLLIPGFDAAPARALIK